MYTYADAVTWFPDPCVPVAEFGIRHAREIGRRSSSLYIEFIVSPKSHIPDTDKWRAPQLWWAVSFRLFYTLSWGGERLTPGVNRPVRSSRIEGG